MKYTLEYLFGMKSLTGKKALMGTIFHKCQELRALAGIAERSNKSFFDDDNFGVVKTKNAISPDWCLDQAFEYYTKIETHLDLGEKEKKSIKNWVNDVISNHPNYDIKNLNVIATEQFFDIEIDKPWAKYKEEINGQTIEGNLRIRGTMDCIVDLGNDTYELVDYKTGEKLTDFATGEEKNLEYFKNDTQLLLYLIALRTLWPNKNWILTLFYNNIDGLYSVLGDDDMLYRAWAMLEKMFKSISKCDKPTQFNKWNSDWRCKYCCSFSKQFENTSKTICQHFHDRIQKEGLNKVQNEMININKLMNYQDGGGRKADE